MHIRLFLWLLLFVNNVHILFLAGCSRSWIYNSWLSTRSAAYFSINSIASGVVNNESFSSGPEDPNWLRRNVDLCWASFYSLFFSLIVFFLHIQGLYQFLNYNIVKDNPCWPINPNTVHNPKDIAIIYATHVKVIYQHLLYFYLFTLNKTEGGDNFGQIFKL